MNLWPSKKDRVRGKDIGYFGEGSAGRSLYTAVYMFAAYWWTGFDEETLFRSVVNGLIVANVVELIREDVRATPGKGRCPAPAVMFV